MKWKIVPILMFFTLPLFAQASAGSIAVVDYTKVLGSSDYAKKLSNDLVAWEKSKQQEVETRKSKVKSLQSQLDGPPALSDDKRAQTAKDLRAAQAELQFFAEDAQKEDDERTQRAQVDLLSHLKPVIEAVAKEKGFSLVLFANQGVPYFAPTIDITGEVLQRFNAATKTAAPATPPKPQQ